MPSVELHLSEAEQAQLKQVAYDSVHHGLQHHEALPVSLESYGENFQQVLATFVTLHRDGDLRGCVGTLEAKRSLVEDVAHNAFAAAFRDTRFEPLRKEEETGLDLHISILTPSTAMEVHSEKDLLAQLQPGIDGLVLEADGRRATFLPSVWKQLPDPADFLAHLKRKAGLPARAWDEEFRFFRYYTMEF